MKWVKLFYNKGSWCSSSYARKKCQKSESACGRSVDSFPDSSIISQLNISKVLWNYKKITLPSTSKTAQLPSPGILFTIQRKNTFCAKLNPFWASFPTTKFIGNNLLEDWIWYEVNMKLLIEPQILSTLILFPFLQPVMTKVW